MRLSSRQDENKAGRRVSYVPFAIIVLLSRCVFVEWLSNECDVGIVGTQGEYSIWHLPVGGHY